MSRNISTLLQEADSIIEKRASETANVVPAVESEDIFKIAAELRQPSRSVDTDLTMFEKIAHAIALVDTLINANEIAKIASFEEKAASAGYSPEQVCDYFEKNASVKFRSVLDLIVG